MAGRLMINDGGLTRAARAGDGFLQACLPQVIATDAVATLDVSRIAAGVVAFTGFTAARVLTTDTAANILAAFPFLDIGDSVAMKIGISTAFAGTLAAGTGVTLKGKAAVPASGAATLFFIRTGAATFDCLAV